MHPHPTTKRCTKCGVGKSPSEFYKSKQHADGLFPWCKACRRVYDARPAIRERASAYKQRPEVRERGRKLERLRNQHPDAKARKRRMWAAWASEPGNRARMRERQRQRWATDPELRAHKRDYLRQRYHENAAHKRKQIEYAMRAIHARRARKQQSGGSYTTAEWRELCAKYGHACLCCGKAVKLTPDHVVPIAKGGANDISNIQPLCLPCNLRKATKTTDYRSTYPPVAFG